VPALLDAAGSDDTRTRRFALRALAYLADPRAWPLLAQALADPEARVRREAARGLCAPAPVALEPLADAARRVGNDGVRDAAYAAVEALASHGQAGAGVVHDLALGEGNLFAAAYLAARGDAAARLVLVDALGGPDERQYQAVNLWTSLDPDVAAAQAMAACVPRMEPWRTRRVFGILAGLAVPVAFEALAGGCHSTHSVVRRGAVRALGGSADPRAAQLILDAAVDGDAKGPRYAGRRTLEGLRRCLELQERIARDEPLTVHLVQAVACSPGALWDAARRRVVADASGRDAEQLRSLVGRIEGRAARFCLEQLLAAATDAPDEDATAEEEWAQPPCRLARGPSVR
jgi:HEAT repeat protein